VHFHDWWLYLVISTFGTVIYDERPTLLYRQHGGNQIGHGQGWIGRQWQMIRFIWANDWVGILLAQVRALITHYGIQMPEEANDLIQRNFLVDAVDARPRWRLVFSPRQWQQTAPRDAALRLLLALHRLHLWPPSGRRISNSPTRAYGKRAD
jgi:hypothetical protein